MSPIVLKVIFTVVIGGIKLLRRYYGSLTPEQRAELEKAAKENYEHAGSMGSGAGEGELPKLSKEQQIIIEHAIDPYKGDGRVNN